MSDDVGAAEASTYNRTEGVSGFDWEHPERVHVRRDVTISVRFSEGEIARLRARAEDADVKVTSFIRAAALDAISPVDRTALAELARELEQRARAVAALAGRGAA